VNLTKQALKPTTYQTLSALLEKSGKARAEKLTPVQRKQIARRMCSQTTNLFVVDYCFHVTEKILHLEEAACLAGG
jgi:hypothetical protein